MRNYKRKRPEGWSDKNLRMARAARHRAEGKSLRESAAEMNVSHQTVANDLARWDQAQAAVPSNVIPLSSRVSRAAVKNDPGSGQVLTPGIDTARTTADAIGLSSSEERIARAVAYLTGQGA